MREIARRMVRDLAIPVGRRAYTVRNRPSAETPAAVRILVHLGTNAVGISTVGTVIVAGARVAHGIWQFLDRQCGSRRYPERLSHS